MVAQQLKIKEVMSVFSEHLNATQPVEVSGKTYSPEQIKENFQELVSGFSAVDAKITSYQPAIDSLKRQVALQDRQLATY